MQSSDDKPRDDEGGVDEGSTTSKPRTLIMHGSNLPQPPYHSSMATQGFPGSTEYRKVTQNNPELASATASRAGYPAPRTLSVDTVAQETHNGPLLSPFAMFPYHNISQQQYTAQSHYYGQGPAQLGYYGPAFGQSQQMYYQNPSTLAFSPHNYISSQSPIHDASSQTGILYNPEIHIPAEQNPSQRRQQISLRSLHQKTDRRTHPQMSTQVYPASRIPEAESSKQAVSFAKAGRGPPRKPKQSGFALWVGNLPPHTSILELKDHLSTEATEDIQSVKLISKTNCAFVNYRSYASCQAALQRFHEVRFNGQRLVCRLRRDPSDVRSEASTAKGPTTETFDRKLGNEEQTDSPTISASRRFFVLKSLTAHDLEESTRTGVWATQAHNEPVLNAAYNGQSEVFLFFSVNKSGEYFGLARMESLTSKGNSQELYSAVYEPANLAKLTGPDTYLVSGTVAEASIVQPSLTAIPLQEHTPTLEALESGLETPVTAVSAALSHVSLGSYETLTRPTKWAPSGRLISDPERDTVFWESTYDSDPESKEEATREGDIRGRNQQISGDPRRWTQVMATSEVNAFRLQWLSLRKVPFYKTRGMRNAYNGGREVKIARDGTEIEPGVGQKLMDMFGPPRRGSR